MPSATRGNGFCDSLSAKLEELVTVQAQPKTIFSDLIEQVFASLKRGSASEFQLKAWERAAEKLSRANLGESLEVRAHVCAIRGDHPEADRLYAAALGTSSDYMSAAVRYLGLLFESHRPEKLLEVFRSVSTAFQGVPDATRFVENFLASEGFVIAASKLNDDLVKMGAFHSGATPSAWERGTTTQDFEGCDDKDFGAPVAFAKRFLREREVGPKGVRVSPISEDGAKCSIFVQLSIDRTPSDAVDLEMELFEALEAQEFSLEREGRVVLALVGTRVELA